MRLSRVYCVVARGAVMSTNVPAGRVAGGGLYHEGNRPGATLAQPLVLE